jgi:hypothetical protein
MLNFPYKRLRRIAYDLFSKSFALLLERQWRSNNHVAPDTKITNNVNGQIIIVTATINKTNIRINVAVAVCANDHLNLIAFSLPALLAVKGFITTSTD